VKRTFGADEAGRGPILGPMVVAVVALDRGGAIALRKRGLADSKAFGAGPDAIARRAELAALVRERAVCFASRTIDVEEIDRYTFRGQLNALERMTVHDLLETIGCAPDEKIICDGAVLFSPLRTHYPNLQAVDHGEQAHASVAAASILAKDARDQAFAAIAARYEPDFGPIKGGGYLNAATRRFLDAYHERHGDLPPEARRSWGAPKDDTLPLFDEADC
jgi:ribonuclease HII